MQNNYTQAGLYIHFPFCASKCIYCDFYSEANRETDIERFTKAILREIQYTYRHFPSFEIDTIFWGGGTPGLIPPSQLESIFNSLYKYFKINQHSEITMEINPGEIDQDKLNNFRNLGVNRLSIGVQSFQSEILQFLTRIHSGQDALDTFSMARKAGFENINCDMIYNIPGQDLSSWKNDLMTVVELNPEHLSAYSLTIEKRTKLYQRVKQGKVKMPGEEKNGIKFQETRAFLIQRGFQHIEVSNFAQMGFACKHNLHYWRIEPYLGLGPAAHSYDGTKRWSNIRSLDRYLAYMEKGESPVNHSEIIDRKIYTNEIIGFGLRLNEGFEINKIPLLYRSQVQDNLNRCAKKWDDLIWMDGGTIKLKPEGFIFADGIAVDMLIEQHGKSIQK